MLERILNISAGSDYKSSTSKSGSYHRTSQFLTTLQSSLSDSISLSPATAFLSSVHWRLKKINFEKEKYIITFEFDGFEFTAYLGQPDILITHSIEYEVKRKVEHYTKLYEASLQIISSVSEQKEKPGSRIAMPELFLFVIELLDLEDLTYSLNSENAEVKKIFYQKSNMLQTEFNYLNSCLVAFLEKYLSIKYNFTASALSKNESLLLRKVLINKL
ncbi:MAG: hypothetical protein FD143_1816 [Ignavibacteria bacterium]|nr:MAG: hypothetical protein FD143_1816 [Ignavibacteria bacterium]KAF0160163.1 MAG: hypothetical protein FD188_1977 [Ignavibacteria bacterium]